MGSCLPISSAMLTINAMPMPLRAERVNDFHQRGPRCQPRNVDRVVHSARDATCRQRTHRLRRASPPHTPAPDHRSRNKEPAPPTTSFVTVPLAATVDHRPPKPFARDIPGNETIPQSPEDEMTSESKPFGCVGLRHRCHITQAETCVPLPHGRNR